MNCAITVRQPSTHPAPVPTTAATNKPATAPEAAQPIRSTDDLIKEFPDQFKGIGQFPGKYKIRLCHDAHPVINASSVPRAQLISQHVDTGQLNIPPQLCPITSSLTKITLD